MEPPNLDQATLKAAVRCRSQGLQGRRRASSCRSCPRPRCCCCCWAQCRRSSGRVALLWMAAPCVCCSGTWARPARLPSGAALLLEPRRLHMQRCVHSRTQQQDRAFAAAWTAAPAAFPPMCPQPAMTHSAGAGLRCSRTAACWVAGYQRKACCSCCWTCATCAPCWPQASRGLAQVGTLAHSCWNPAMRRQDGGHSPAVQPMHSFCQPFPACCLATGACAALQGPAWHSVLPGGSHQCVATAPVHVSSLTVAVSGFEVVLCRASCSAQCAAASGPGTPADRAAGRTTGSQQRAGRCL